MTVQGMMQHWQSSPHQHDLGPGGLMPLQIGFAIEELLVEETDVELEVLGGMADRGWFDGLIASL